MHVWMYTHYCIYEYTSTDIYTLVYTYTNIYEHTRHTYTVYVACALVYLYIYILTRGFYRPVHV